MILFMSQTLIFHFLNQYILITIWQKPLQNTKTFSFYRSHLCQTHNKIMSLSLKLYHLLTNNSEKRLVNYIYSMVFTIDNKSCMKTQLVY